MEKRIQKIISECGITSRRNAEELIISGLVKVNGTVAKIGQKADLDKDEIIVKGRTLKPVQKLYLAMNKPAGLVTSTKDPFEKTIMEAIPEKYKKLGIYPVGRLDKYTEGLIFLTNDGDFANKLMHPRFKIEKRYEGICTGIVSKEDMKKLQDGIRLEEGLARCKIFAEPKNDGSYFVMKISTGWNRQVRRMMEAVGHKVLKLRRTNIANYSIESLGKRQIKVLTKGEANAISESIKLSKFEKIVEIEKKEYESEKSQKNEKAGEKNKAHGEDAMRSQIKKQNFEKKEERRQKYSKPNEKEFSYKEHDERRIIPKNNFSKKPLHPARNPSQKSGKYRKH